MTKYSSYKESVSFFQIAMLYIVGTFFQMGALIPRGVNSKGALILKFSKYRGLIFGEGRSTEAGR